MDDNTRELRAVRALYGLLQPLLKAFWRGVARHWDGDGRDYDQSDASLSLWDLWRPAGVSEYDQMHMTAMRRVFPRWVALMEAEPVPHDRFRRWITAIARRSAAQLDAQWNAIRAQWQTHDPDAWAAVVADAQAHGRVFSAPVDDVRRGQMAAMIDAYWHDNLVVELRRPNDLMPVAGLTIATPTPSLVHVPVQGLALADGGQQFRLCLTMPCNDEDDIPLPEYIRMESPDIARPGQVNDDMEWRRRTPGWQVEMRLQVRGQSALWYFHDEGLLLPAVETEAIPVPSLAQCALVVLLRQWPQLSRAQRRRVSAAAGLDCADSLAKRPREDDETRLDGESVVKWPRITYE
jgi:hypothetical protein